MISHQKSEIPPPIPGFSLTGILSPLVFIPMLAVALVALVAPEDVLTRHEAVRMFAFTVRSVLLSISPSADIAAHAYSTRYPEVALLTNSVLWTLLLWNSAVYLIITCLNYPITLARRKPLGRFTVKEIGTIASGLIFFPMGLPILTMMPGDPSYMSGITTQSRFGFAFIASSSLWLASMMIGGMPVLFWTIFSINAKRE